LIRIVIYLLIAAPLPKMLVFISSAFVPGFCDFGLGCGGALVPDFPGEPV
jgi:hypothetical protein